VSWALLLAIHSGWTLGAVPGGGSCAPEKGARAYAEARRSFDAGKFDESIERLMEAYACDPNPVYLGNIARAHEEAHRPNEAISAWRQYLDKITDPKEQTAVAGRISALSKLVDDLEKVERAKTEAEAARRRAEENVVNLPREEEARVSPWAWAATGAGAAAIAAGVVLGLIASSRHSSAVREVDVVRANDDQHQAHDFATAANISYAVGGVSFGAGLLWMAIDLFDSSK
jgi:hypothetical protein